MVHIRVSSGTHATKCSEGNQVQRDWISSADTITEATATPLDERVRTESLYRGIVDLASEGIWRTDEFGKTQLFNARLTEMLGTNPGRIRDGAIHEFVSPQSIPDFEARWNAIKAGHRQKFDCGFVGSGNVDFWAQVSASPMHTDDGRFEGALILLTDISSRRQAEEYLRKAKQEADSANEAKSRFLANMSHEIRTPLGAVLGFAELLLDDDQTEQQRLDCVHAIRRNGRLLLDLINDILDLSKVEAGHLEVEAKPCSLLDLVVELQTLFKPEALKRHLQYQIDVAPDLPRWIATDPIRLRQVLINLIGNAMKFTERGKVQVQLSRDNQHLVCRVADSGIGIRTEDAEKLFTPFMQADTTIARRFGGTGLGLALSRNLARALGGDVRLASSEPGHGSVFECRVELRTPSTSSPPSHRASMCSAPSTTLGASPAEARPLDHVEILAVDDSPDNRLLLKRLLQKTGAHVTLAENGIDAVSLALRGGFDVVLMDIQMPIMDGYEATRTLRAQGYRGPIIALTAHAMKEERDVILDAGCDRHVAKPIDRDDLIEAIRDVLRSALQLH